MPKNLTLSSQIGTQEGKSTVTNQEYVSMEQEILEIYDHENLLDT